MTVMVTILFVVRMKMTILFVVRMKMMITVIVGNEMTKKKMYKKA